MIFTSLQAVSNCLHILENIILCNRYKFDDERVTKEDTKKAFEEQYGGEEEVCSISHRY